MDEERLGSWVETALSGEVMEGRKMLVEYPWVVLLQGRLIEEYTYMAISLNAAAFDTLAQDRRGDDIARLQFIDKAFPALISLAPEDRAASDIRPPAKCPPFILEILHPIDVRPAELKVAEEAHLHAVLDQRLARKFRVTSCEPARRIITR